MTVLKVLRAQPTLFFRLSGIREADFDTLVSTLHPIWLDREEKRLSRKDRQRAIGSGMSYRLEFVEQLLLCLIYYRTYTSHAFMGILPQCVLPHSLPPRPHYDGIDGGPFSDAGT